MSSVADSGCFNKLVIYVEEWVDPKRDFQGVATFVFINPQRDTDGTKVFCGMQT